ncbi:unnamed protein product [Phytophthora lilii]|uniref:Unnamed protein product n=1 Tax=Phytophthora lilii TaxID=2077276 RepID=A0A9W6TAR3_9STRA|nr:unnamed protein product [Phytophthora lilii]
MREQWEAAQAGLRVFLEEDSAFVQFLEGFEQDLVRRLRFERRSRGGLLVDCISFDRFVETAALLRHFHALFQAKLKPLEEPSVRGDTGSVDKKCSDLVENLTEMLHVVRVLYGQLFCRSQATQTALESALKSKDSEWDAELLSKYLEKRKITAEKLVSLPLKRFDALVEFVEALSKTLSEESDDGAVSSSSDAGSEEKHNYAPQLIHIVQESKHNIHLAKADAREEEELIELQTSFRGDGADAFANLSQSKLLLRGEVFLSLPSTCSGQRVNGLESAATLFCQAELCYAHCFSDGRLVCSNRQEAESGSSFTIQHLIHLKQDAVFLELIPASVPVLDLSEESHALALIMQDTALVLSWKDAAETQRWADAIGGFLEINDLRSDALHQLRTMTDLVMPEDIIVKPGDEDTIPKDFVSFYDDHLPGVFWMAPDENSITNKYNWDVVEIVFYSRWLVVFKLDGWKGHSAVCHFDTHEPGMEISEQPRGDKEWSLFISTGSASNLTLVSKKRTRIDYWFDQVWKAVESAQVSAKRAERERIELKEMEEEEAHTRAHAKKQGEQSGKKRKLSVTSSNTSRVLEDKREPASSLSPGGSSGSKPGDKTDEECGELDKTSQPVEEDSTVKSSARKKPRRFSDKPKQQENTDLTEDTTVNVIASPALKTPKRRWLKRKSDDPNDTALIPTQPSPSLPTDESASDTQLPANEVQVGGEPKTQEMRIILTGVEPTAAIRKKIDSIAGAVYEEDVENATHILAPKNQLKRTVKLLCGISRCTHVLDVRWLDESARVGTPIYERAHCLKDAKAESKWHFDLRKTMYDFTPEQRRQLFAGQQVFITNHKSVLPPVKDLAKIVECAGGTAVTKGSAGPNDVVITSEAALSTASVRKALAQANPQRIYSAELILSSILQQRIDFDKNRLEQPAGGSRRRR